MNYVSEIQNFKRMGHDLVDQIAEYLESSLNETSKVINYNPATTEYEYWKDYQPLNMTAFHSDLFARSIRLHHPNYMGHQVSAPNLQVALLGLTSDLMNNGMGIYEMGAAAVAMEQYVINTFSNHIGYDTTHSNGFLTSGGTLANLTALLAARASCQDLYPNIDNEHIHIIVSEQAHFCIERAWLTMGLPARNIHKVDVNSAFQINPQGVESTYRSIIDNQGVVLAVVGCACSTATGSYDDIGWLSSFCQRNKLWLHVDGAHGGAVVFSKKLKKELLQGIEMANSVVIDAHKMMQTPALATAVLFKNYLDSYSSFSQKASYLFDQSEIDPYNLAKRTYETTKYMMSIKVFFLMKSVGIKHLALFIERQYALTSWLYHTLVIDSDFDCAHQPQSNILCFRYIKSDDINTINRIIREELLQEGKFYIVSTILNGRYYLRVTLMNHWTEKRHLEALIDNIKHKAQEISLRSNLIS